MDYAGFIARVEQGAGSGGVDREEATRVMRATLQTLAEHLDRGEARRLAAQLPPELAPWIATTTPAERFDADEFVRRVSERAQVDPPRAWRGARAVLDALAAAVPEQEWHAMASELPRSFAPLLPRGPDFEVMPRDELLAKVAKRAGIDFESAERATNAVLEALARRIAPGEVNDLIVRLPIELHAPLERGRAEMTGEPSSMRWEQFIDAIAHHERVDPGDAVRHARAVLGVLREAVGEREFLDVVAQLPDEYVRTLALRSPS